MKNYEKPEVFVCIIDEDIVRTSGANEPSEPTDNAFTKDFFQ